MMIATAAKLLQSCPALWDPIDGNAPGSPIPGILRARTWEWVAISFSNAWKWKVKVKSLSHVWLVATPWTAAYQAPPSMGFSRQEYWSGVPLASPEMMIRSTLFLQTLFQEISHCLRTKPNGNKKINRKNVLKIFSHLSIEIYYYYIWIHHPFDKKWSLQDLID